MIRPPERFTTYPVIVGCDPSISSPGLSLFCGQRLVAVGRPRPAPNGPSTAEEEVAIGDRARWIAGAIQTWYLTAAANAYAARAAEAVAFHAPALVAEWPQIYTDEKSRGDKNDLPHLAAVAATVADRIGCPFGMLATPWPRQWIGQIQKTKTGNAWESPRGHLIWHWLTDEERAVVTAAGKIVNHDVVDGIGLGLWGTGRLRHKFVIHR